MSKELVKSYVKEINDLHAEVFGAVKMTLDKAIRIGELLTKCKEKIPHGEWMQWMRINLEFAYSTAARYMQVYDERANIKVLPGESFEGGLKGFLGYKPDKKQEVKLLEGKKTTTVEEAIEAEVVPEPEVVELTRKYNVKEDGVSFDKEWWEDRIIRIRDKLLDNEGMDMSVLDEPWKHWTHVEITLRLIKER